MIAQVEAIGASSRTILALVGSCLVHTTDRDQALHGDGLGVLRFR